MRWQAYVVCELPQKLDLLWAFIKQHLRNRTLIFVSTCKQVCDHICIDLHVWSGPRRASSQACLQSWHSVRISRHAGGCCTTEASQQALHTWMLHCHVQLLTLELL